jgi:hypothetical protein
MMTTEQPQPRNYHLRCTQCGATRPLDATHNVTYHGCAKDGMWMLSYDGYWGNTPPAPPSVIRITLPDGSTRLPLGGHT